MPVGGGAWPDNESTRRAAYQQLASLVWRAPEGLVGLAAVPVGGGGAWPGFEATRRAKLAARTARGRAAAHGHTKQPGSLKHQVSQLHSNTPKSHMRNMRAS